VCNDAHNGMGFGPPSCAYFVTSRSVFVSVVDIEILELEYSPIFPSTAA
jgi:hypothetical protein